MLSSCGNSTYPRMALSSGVLPCRRPRVERLGSIATRCCSLRHWARAWPLSRATPARSDYGGAARTRSLLRSSSRLTPTIWRSGPRSIERPPKSASNSSSGSAFSMQSSQSVTRPAPRLGSISRLMPGCNGIAVGSPSGDEPRGQSAARPIRRTPSWAFRLRPFLVETVTSPNCSSRPSGARCRDSFGAAAGSSCRSSTI